MFTLLTLGAVMMGMIFVFAMLAVILKLVFWVAFLPFRLVGLVFKLALGVLLLPVLAVAGVILLVGVGIAAVAAIVVPLIPVALAVLVVWGLARILSRPAAVAPPHA